MVHFIWKTAAALAAACFLYNIVVYLLFRFGFVGETRDERGRLKERQSWKGIAGILGFLLLTVAALFALDWLLLPQSAELGFWAMAGIHLIVITLLVVYDSLVIDLLVIGVIRPKFLHLPEKMDLAEMKIHVKRTFVVCWFITVPVSLIAALLFHVIFVS